MIFSGCKDSAPDTVQKMTDTPELTDNAPGATADISDAATDVSGDPLITVPELPASLSIIEDMVLCYGAYGAEAKDVVQRLFMRLREEDSAAAEKWKRIMSKWSSVNGDLEIHYDVLPDGLPDTDELCFIVLGFQLNPDGSMRPELLQRLEVVRNSAEKYPNAYIVCTGGGTASANPSSTEAGKMAEWLIDNGIDESRIIVEDKSITTSQNAIYSCDILEQQYPQVKQLVIISSDYHIATGALVFEAEIILRTETEQDQKLSVVSNAACAVPSTLSTIFQAGALIELAGDADTAFSIYHGVYDIPEFSWFQGI